VHLFSEDQGLHVSTFHLRSPSVILAEPILVYHPGNQIGRGESLNEIEVGEVMVMLVGMIILKGHEFNSGHTWPRFAIDQYARYFHIDACAKASNHFLDFYLVRSGPKDCKQACEHL
jgi:hypothetical protein